MSARRASTWRFTAGGIAVLLSLLALVAGWSAGSLDRALDAFDDGGPADETAVEVERQPNAVAWELHRLATQIQSGGARPAGPAPWPEDAAANRFLEAAAQKAWSANYRYLWHAMDPQDAPRAPDGLETWFETHAAAYDAIVALLTRDEVPDWGFHPGSGNLSEAPGGAWTLQRHLLGRALYQAARGDAAASERTMLAAWRLEDSMTSGSAASAWSMNFNSPSVSILRQVRPADARAWIARLDARQPRRDLDAHLRWTARRARREVEQSEARVPAWLPRGVKAQLIALVDAPARLRATRNISALAEVASELRRLPPCADPVLELHAPASEGIGSILADPLSRPRPPGLEYDFARLRQLEIDLAVTRRVLALDAGIDEPPRREGACADPPVTQSLGADGQWTVGWGSAVAWPAGSGLRDVVDALIGDAPAPPRAPPSFTFRPRVPPAVGSAASP